MAGVGPFATEPGGLGLSRKRPIRIRLSCDFPVGECGESQVSKASAPFTGLAGTSSRAGATWAAARRLDRCYVDLPHFHHRVERALGGRLIMTRRRF